MSEFNFKSNVCTSIEQSKRLLVLGLKKETADMVYKPHYVNGVLKGYFTPKILEKKVLEYMLTDEAFKDYIPAWSLHRLMDMMPKNIVSSDNIVNALNKFLSFGNYLAKDIRSIKEKNIG